MSRPGPQGFIAGPRYTGPAGGGGVAARGAGRRHPSWRPAPPPRRDRRDQLGLRIGWVRFWLRAIALGFGLWLMSAALGLWPQLQALSPPFFYGGLLLMPAGGVLALLTWIAPLPFERPATCPACRQSHRVLVLPWPLEFFCPGCGRHGTIHGGQIRSDPPA